MLNVFIGDGYDQTFFIKGTDLYPECKFTGRAMASHQSTRLVKKAMHLADTAGTDAELKYYEREVVARISSWQAYDPDTGAWAPFTDNKGADLPINAASLAGLQPKLAWKIRDIILGTEAGDPDPHADDEGNPPATPKENAKN